MAVSGGQVIVEILANTAGFTAGIAKAEAGIAGIQKTSRAGWGADALMKRSGLDQTLSSVKSMSAESAVLAARLKNVKVASDGAGHGMDGLRVHTRRAHIGFLGVRASTVGAGVAVIAAAQAFHHLQEGLAVTGDKAFTMSGRVRNAAAALTTLDVVGAVMAFDLQRTSGSVEELTNQINKVNASGLRGGEGMVTHAIDSVALLIGVDRQRERQLERLTNLSYAYASSIDAIIAADPTKFHDANMAAAVPVDRVPGSNPDGTLKAFHPFAGLTQAAQTAIAGAEAGGSSSQRLAQYNRALAALKKQEKLGHLTDAQRETIYNAEASIQGKIDGIYADRAQTARDAAEKAKQLREAAAAKAKAAKDKMVSTLSDAIDGMQSALANAVQTQASAFGSLFGGPVLNPTEGGSTGGGHKGWFGALAGGKHSGAKTVAQKINADLDAQLSQYQKLGRNLTSLKKRGASPELISQLLASGDNAKIAELAGEGKGPLQHFFKTFEKGQALIKGAAAMSVQAKDVHLTAGVVHLTAGKAGGQNSIHVTLEVDGKKMAETTVTHLNKQSKSASGSRKGRNRGKTTGVS